MGENTYQKKSGHWRHGGERNNTNKGVDYRDHKSLEKNNGVKKHIWGGWVWGVGHGGVLCGGGVGGGGVWGGGGIVLGVVFWVGGGGGGAGGASA